MWKTRKRGHGPDKAEKCLICAEGAEPAAAGKHTAPSSVGRICWFAKQELFALYRTRRGPMSHCQQDQSVGSVLN